MHWIVARGDPFIVLRSRGVSQIYHTYTLEDVHPYNYPPLPWVHIVLVGVVYPLHIDRSALLMLTITFLKESNEFAYIVVTGCSTLFSLGKYPKND